jgi:hypothetical protein
MGSHGKKSLTKFNKIRLPSVGWYFTLDSWATGRREYFRDQYFKEALQKGMEKERALEHAAKESQRASSDLTKKCSVHLLPFCILTLLIE